MLSRVLSRTLNLAPAGARAMSSSNEPLKRTALYGAHASMGAKFTDFCGWDMPLRYKDSAAESHIHCRNHAVLFDVSHMGQIQIVGKDRIQFMESLLPADLKSLKPDHAKLSMLTNEKGGIKDDLVITNQGDNFYVVLNAGCRDADMAHIRQHLERFRSSGGDCDVVEMDQHSLIALQGPKAMQVLSKYVDDDLTKMGFMVGHKMVMMGIECNVTRCGYTGEDGFEISVPTNKAEVVFYRFCEHDEVRPAGLTARDTLRMEAGLCLYGNDIDETTTPVEAGLAFCINKPRRETGGFLGADVILAQLKDKTLVKRKRVGLTLEGPPARQGYKIFDADGSRQIGEITSGCVSPILKKRIAHGYVEREFSKSNTPVAVEVRGKMHPAVTTKMPFVPANYYRVPQ